MTTKVQSQTSSGRSQSVKCATTFFCLFVLIEENGSSDASVSLFDFPSASTPRCKVTAHYSVSQRLPPRLAAIFSPIRPHSKIIRAIKTGGNGSRAINKCSAWFPLEAAKRWNYQFLWYCWDVSFWWTREGATLFPTVDTYRLLTVSEVKLQLMSSTWMTHTLPLNNYRSAKI